MPKKISPESMKKILKVSKKFYRLSNEKQKELINAEVKKLFPEPGHAHITKQDVLDLATLKVLKDMISIKEDHNERHH